MGRAASGRQLHRGFALEVVTIEAQRRVPVEFRTDLHAALSQADSFRGGVLRNQARRGGKARKSNALQELIIEIIRRRPIITRDELLEQLGGYAPGPVIAEINEEAISFAGKGGAIRSAPLSGLKDRLTRARKMCNSR